MRPIVSSLLAAGLGLALSIYPAPARGTTAEAHVSVRIPLASGAVARVELPAGTEVERTSSAGDSWILAGTRPVGERREILLITGQGASGTGRTYPAPAGSGRSRCRFSSPAGSPGSPGSRGPNGGRTRSRRRDGRGGGGRGPKRSPGPGRGASWRSPPRGFPTVRGFSPGRDSTAGTTRSGGAAAGRALAGPPPRGSPRTTACRTSPRR